MAARLIILTISDIEKFNNTSNPTDDRNGRYYTSLAMAEADPKTGEIIKHLDTRGAIHTGLPETYHQAWAIIADKAHAIIDALEALSIRVVVDDRSGNWNQYSDNSLYSYLRNLADRKALQEEIARKRAEVAEANKCLQAMVLEYSSR